MWHTYRNVSPYAVAQMIARVRDSGEVWIALNDFEGCERFVDDPDELRERLWTQAQRVKLFSPERIVHGGAMDDEAFFDFWVHVEAEKAFSYNNHVALLETIMERYGWETVRDDD